MNVNSNNNTIQVKNVKKSDRLNIKAIKYLKYIIFNVLLKKRKGVNFFKRSV